MGYMIYVEFDKDNVTKGSQRAIACASVNKHFLFFEGGKVWYGCPNATMCVDDGMKPVLAGWLIWM